MKRGTRLFDIHRGTARGGLRLLVVPMTGTSTVTFMVSVRTGSRNERPEEAGISHFLEHLFFKGSRKRPTHREISEALDRIGGEFNAFTSKETTSYYAKASAEHAELIVDVIGDMLLHPLFDAAEIERERGVVIEEMNMYEDTPLQSIDEFAEETLYGTHPLARKIIGTKNVIARVSRAAILSYVRRQYGVRNTVACLTGNVSPDAGMTLLARAFNAFPRARPRLPRRFSGTWGRHRVAVKEKKTDQAHVIVATPGVSYLHPDRTAVDVLSTILGAGMSSRLFIEVRERRGLSYSVRTTPQHFTDIGHVSTQMGVDPGKLAEAVKVILREYGKIRDTRVGVGELQKAQENMKGRLLMHLEASDEVAQFAAGQEVLQGRILTVDEVFKRIDAITARDVQRVAQAYLASRGIRIAAIAPGQDAVRLEHLLQTTP